MSPRLALIIPDLRPGGAERVSVNIANALAERGYRVDVVALSAEGALAQVLRPDVNVVDLRVNRVRYALLPIVRYLRRAQPSVALACMWPLTVLALWARWIAGTPTRMVVAEHCTWSRSELLNRWSARWQVRTSMRRFFPKADAIVAVSVGAADDLAAFADLPRSSITVLYNPVVSARGLPFHGELEPTEWWHGSHKRLLAVGTLKEIKDYGTLIDAVALLRRHVDARLLILGEGDCRPPLEAQIRRLGLAEAVFMPGFVGDPTPYYERADLHVLSSRSEGLPTVMIEALAAGTPVVSTDCPSGPREILADGRFGALVPVADAPALATAMAASLAGTHDPFALRTRAQEFSIDKAVDRYETLLFPQHAGQP